MSRDMLEIVVLFSAFVTAYSGGVVTPTNTAVYAGERLTLECRVNSGSNFVCWTYHSFETPLKEPICVFNDEGRFHNKFRHFGAYSNSDGSIVFYTNATKLEDAGIYACEIENSGKTVQYRAQVIVINSKPYCSTNLTKTENRTLIPGTNIWMQCTMEFTGHWIPNMIWRQIFGNAVGIIIGKSNGTAHGNFSFTYSNSTVTSTLKINLDLTYHDSYFECEIYFSTRNSSGNIEISTEFSYIWATPTIYLMLITENKTDAVTTRRSLVTTNNDNPDSEWSITTVVLVVLVATLFVVVAALAIAYVHKFRTKIKGKTNFIEEKRATSGEYDFIPDTSNAYDKIDEEQIEHCAAVGFAPRQGHLPIAGYSALLPAVPAESGNCGRMDSYEMLEKGRSEDPDACNYQCTAVNGQNAEVNHYEVSKQITPSSPVYRNTRNDLAIIDCAEDDDTSRVHSYLEVVDNDPSRVHSYLEIVTNVD